MFPKEAAMRWPLTRLVILLAMVTMQPVPSLAAQLPHNCSHGQAPSFAHGLSELREQLGTAMGDPVECEQPDPATGDVAQQTTTGMAIYRKDTDTALFTNGRELWTLSNGGLAHSSGWHGNAGPLAPVSPTDIDNEAPAAVTYAQVEAATIVRTLDNDGRRLVVQHAGTSYLVETAEGCGDGQPLDGRPAFIVSPAAFAGPESRLILTPGAGECRIADSHPL
jgi:hypothetical protein